MLFRFNFVLMYILTFLFSLPVISSADDPQLRASTLFRERDYTAAYSVAAKMSEAPQRFFIMGVAALRSGKPDEALPLLMQAEQKLPLLADYATLYQAEALLKLKKYQDASAMAASVAAKYPTSQQLRRSVKLYADIFVEAGDCKGALTAMQAFAEKYPSGADAVDALYHVARCREELGDKSGAMQAYNSIWLNNPAAPQAGKADERMKNMEKSGVKGVSLSAEDLLKRALSLYSQNRYAEALRNLDTALAVAQTPPLVSRIELRKGLTLYRLRQYKQAEKQFAKVAVSTLHDVSSEARFWHAKALERQEHSERVVVAYLELAAEGKKQEFADDALMEAAGLRRTLGQFAEAAKLFEQFAVRFPESKFISRAAWEAGWCRYLEGNYPTAIESFKKLLKDDSQREKCLYWLARAYENSNSPDAASYYRTLLDEFPAGFYATWHRDQKGIRDIREPLGARNAIAELPLLTGFDKPRMLASLGLIDEARAELSALRKKNGEKKGLFPGLARIYLEMRDYSSAIPLFMQNRPIPWEKGSLPLWTAGYPLDYTELVSRNAALNNLSEALVYALIRAESAFSPAIRSSAGAIGLMQMMPATAQQTAREKGHFDPQRLTIPEVNIRLGTKHLHDLMKSYNNDVVFVAAAYNAGSGAVERWRKNLKELKKDEFIESIPYQETRDYVKKVYASAAIYRQLYGLK
ncbi:MAG TPA: transglycosylase SLT domain-containing protein [Desulfuromonadales bacterium]|nr:transglycosylase SLT domain-containing protein [Desulfuromonadales bacterium]